MDLSPTHSVAISHSTLQYTRAKLLQLNCVGVRMTAFTATLYFKRPWWNWGQNEGEEKERGKQGGVSKNSGSPGFHYPLWTSSPWGIKWTGSKETLVFWRTSGTAVSWLSERLGWQSMTRTLTWNINGSGAPYRLDWQAEVTQKSQGGRACLYFNKRYCTFVTREHICSS